MLALLLVAVSLGLSNFAASVGLGASGVDRSHPAAGGPGVRVLRNGHADHRAAGRARGGRGPGARHPVARCGPAHRYRRLQPGPGPPVRPRRGQHRAAEQRAAEWAAGARLGPLLVTGLALSLDNLAVGFALGAVHVSLPVAVIVIGAVSVTLSLLGLELGHRLSTRIGGRGEILGGLVLIGVGIAVAAGLL